MLVLAAATAVGLGAAALWLPHRHTVTVAEAPDGRLQPAPGPSGGAGGNPVDLSTVKWEYTPRSSARMESDAPMPAVEPAGAPPWQRFAALTPEPQGRPMIAIVIDDLGVDKRRSAQAIALPQPVTLAFLPYATELESQVQEARLLGHELLVHLPMEAKDQKRDPGPHALTTELGDDELLRRLRWDLDRFDGYVGVNNHMGSRFTRDRHAMELIMRELKSRGLLFLDSRTVPDSVGPEIARELQIPFAARQVFLDDDQSAKEVEARLAETARIARTHGYAIAVGHPHDGTLQALHEWMARVQDDGFTLVPVSAIVRHTWAMEHSTARQPG